MAGVKLKRLALGALLVGMLPCGGAAQASPDAQAPSLEQREAAEALRHRADEAYRSHRFADAAALYAELASLPGARSRAVAHYQAACTSALAGDTERAFDHLTGALDAGFRYASHLAADSDLQVLHRDPRWDGAVQRARENLERYEALHADPDSARLVSEDLSRFGAAFERARLAADSAEAVEMFRRYYLEPGSAGLIDFYFSRMQGAEMLAEVAMRRYPAYFGGLAALHDSITARAPQIREAFRRLAELHPGAHFPPVHFVIGHLRSGGTVSENGLLVGVEVFGVTGRAVTDEFPAAAVPVIHTFDRIPFVVAHELVHLQQPPSGPNTLLASALREGGADFIAELVTGTPPDEHHYTWGMANERTVWERFAPAMHHADTSDWIANNHTATDEWPAALGYFVGYRIAQAYHERAGDKLQAARDLLMLDDPLAILQASGYAERFE
jgi:hypothetical protein